MKTMQRHEDPIVTEVRKARAELYAECGNDLHKLFARIKRQERIKSKSPVSSVRRKAVA